MPITGPLRRATLITQRSAALVALSMLAACSNPGDPTSSTEVESVGLSDADKGRVCRAAIASMHERDPATIRVVAVTDGIHRVSYLLEDGNDWTAECRVGNDTAEWRPVANGQPLAWQDRDTIRFTVKGSTINVRTFYRDEPVTSDTYTFE